MYTSYFGLEEKPFSIAPNPDYLFMSDRHREALNHLTYGLGDTGGFVLLTGEVGTGKTTISRRLMENLPENTQAAFILNPTLSSQELLATLCDELKIRYRKNGATLKTLTDKIQQKLLKNHDENINTLLIIDEAQHLQPEVLEQLRLLTNLETNTKKLLQVILIGQPELQQLLQRRDLRQLAQRITARYHLLPLNKQEVEQYLKHRLSVAKCFRRVFDKSAVSAIHKICHGIPRLMNLLAERSLMNAYNSNNAIVNRKIVLQAAHDALGDEFQVKSWWHSGWLKVGSLLVALSLFLVLGIWWGANQFNGINLNVVSTAEHTLELDEQQASIANAPSASAESKAAKDSIKRDSDLLVQEKSKDIISAKHPSNNIAEVVQAATVDKSTSDAEAHVNNGIEKALVEREKNITLAQTTKHKVEVVAEKVNPDNFVVEAAEGVSDELLASFQSAIEQTKQAKQSKQVKQSDNLEDSEVVDDSKLMPLTQMPTWIQEGVPALEFEMHIYASDGQGWVRVNGRDRYEGDYISRELLLNEIRPQKVILSFRGEKFTMDALSSWH